MRHVLGHVPTSVAVVTTTEGDQPVGCTIGSLVSVSLEPPLIAFFAMESSSTMKALSDAGSFAVNVLAHDQQWVCDVFARRQGDRFRKVEWDPGRRGNPRIRKSLAILDCELESVTPAGDHQMILGRVLDLAVERPQCEPLVFARGALRTLSGANSATRHPLLTWLGD
ncbi:flavin reductase family protein [Nocardioides sp. YIM B13467]|uniref:flavin reductase family protein n=1 Tax=Nocardioides sp. YIM B13467 TaxID=3366294 RepID=UPI0036724704